MPWRGGARAFAWVSLHLRGRAGKSTYCNAMYEHGLATKRHFHVVNMDPAAESFQYPVSIGACPQRASRPAPGAMHPGTAEACA